MLKVLFLARRGRYGYTPVELLASIPDRLAHYKNPDNWTDKLVGLRVTGDGSLSLDIQKVYKGYD